MPMVAVDLLLKLLEDYRASRISLMKLASGLQQIYWNMEFDNETEDKAFFDAFFDIEQIAAFQSEECGSLKQSDVEIIARSVDSLHNLAVKKLEQPIRHRRW